MEVYRGWLEVGMMKTKRSIVLGLIKDWERLSLFLGKDTYEMKLEALFQPYSRC